MATLFSYGTKSITMGDFDTATGAITTPVEVPVYKDTVDNQQTEAAETKHYQEGKTSPALVSYGIPDETFKFSVMDTSAAMLLKFLGGTVTTVAGKDTWNKGASIAGKKAGFTFTTTDGCVCRVYGAINAKANNKLTANGIRLIDVTVTPIETGTAIAAVQWDDAVTV